MRLADDPLWYKDAIIYELHVRAFYDSNANGVGDFRGLTQKLDYLQDLGVLHCGSCLFALPHSRMMATTWRITPMCIHFTGHWPTLNSFSARRISGAFA